MKICFVTTTPASAVGGVENVVFNLMNEAKKAGHDVENVFAYERYKNPFASINAYKNVEKKIRNGGFDIVHSNDNASYYFAKNKFLPDIHTSHGTWGNYFSACGPTSLTSIHFGMKNKILSKTSIRIEKFITQHADINTSVSNHVKQSVLNQYSVESRVIHNGADTRKFYPGKPKNKIPTGIWVGTNKELKGLDIAAEAVKMLNFKLIVVGVTGKKDSEVKYMGRVSPQQMPYMYRKADFLLFPSRYESHPIVPLEALASGLPVIVSSACHVEIIKNGKEGFVVNSMQAEDYATAIQKMLAKKKQMSRAARALAQKYTWSKQAKQYFKLYDKL